jgi:hypothetical protein
MWARLFVGMHPSESFEPLAFHHRVLRRCKRLNERVPFRIELAQSSPKVAALRPHKEMCAGRITLKQAQNLLVRDWRVAYAKYYAKPK